MAFLEIADRRLVPKRKADVVEAFQEASSREGIDLEVESKTRVVGDFAVFKVHVELVARMLLGTMANGGDIRLGRGDREDAAVAAVVLEDVGERGRDDNAETEIFHRPGSVLARGTATKILARDQNRRAFVTGLVEHELRPGIAFLVESPIEKKKWSEAGALNAL